MGRPTLGNARNEVLRRLVREVLVTDFDGTQAAAARALGVSGATLSDFLMSKKGAGSQLQDGLVKYLRRSMDQIAASGGDLGALRGLQPAAPITGREVRFIDLPNWISLRAAAEEQRPRHAPWVWERLASARVWLDGPVTPGLVADLADVVARHQEPPV